MNEDRIWLRKFQRDKLPKLRRSVFKPSKFVDEVTLIAYTFPMDEKDFDFVEFAILKSWSLFGKLKVVVIADRMTSCLRDFLNSWTGWVDVQIESSLYCGDIVSMSSDCIQRLYARFETPYCLVVQDDGFPIQDNLGDFLGKWDFVGAPTVRDIPLQKLVDWFHVAGLNGGFSLRSKRFCAAVARSWGFFGKLIRPASKWAVEDVYYTRTVFLNPKFWFRFRFPTCCQARKFAVLDFNGALDIKSLRHVPFGIHGASTASQFIRRSK